MKYVCYKKTVSKVVDQEITDPEDVKAILEVVCNHELTCSVQIKDVHGILSYRKVRIKSLGEDSFQYVTYSSSSTLKREAKYADLLHLEMITVDQVLSVLKPNINRWNLIEAYDDNEE